MSDAPEPGDAEIETARRLALEIGPMLSGHPLTIVITVLEVLTEQALRAIARGYDMDREVVLTKHIEHLRAFMDVASAPRRPRDPSQRAKTIVDIATDEKSDD